MDRVSRLVSCDLRVICDRCEKPHPANPRHSPNAGIMLAECRRQWANIIPTLSQLLLITGYKQDWADRIVSIENRELGDLN